MKRFWLILLAILAMLCFGACQEQPPEKSRYVIAVEKNITEAGTITGAGEYEEDQVVTLVATTNQGYAFLGWYEGTTALSTNVTYTFTASADRAIVAKWEVNAPVTSNRYTIVVQKTIERAGTVTGAGEYDENQVVVLTVTTKEGYVFRGWYEDGYPLGTHESYSFAAMKNRTIVAKWEIEETEEDEDKDWGGGIW